MLVSLSDLGEKLSTSTVVVRGHSVPIRCLKSTESEAVRAVFPRPPVPKIQDPLKGSLAPKIDNPGDPEYRQLVGAREWDLECADVCIACGWQRPRAASETLEAFRTRLVDGIRTLRETLSTPEIHRLFEKLLGMLDEAAARRAQSLLMVDLSNTQLEPVEGFRLPERFGETVAFRWLRACERFSLNPLETDEMDPGMRVLLMAYDDIRREEERVDRMTLEQLKQYVNESRNRAMTEEALAEIDRAGGAGSD